MRFKNLICFAAIVAMLCVTAFAVPKADVTGKTPAATSVEKASPAIAVNTVVVTERQMQISIRPLPYVGQTVNELDAALKVGSVREVPANSPILGYTRLPTTRNYGWIPTTRIDRTARSGSFR